MSHVERKTSARPVTLPAASVTGLADVFRSTWDISALLTSMMLSSDFVAAQGRLVIGPVEWLVGAVRALQVPVADDAVVKKLLVVLQALGQVPFYPPSVGGWPSGQAWMSTAAADLRFATATALAKKADLSWISGAAHRRVEWMKSATGSASAPGPTEAVRSCRTPSATRTSSSRSP